MYRVSQKNRYSEFQRLYLLVYRIKNVRKLYESMKCIQITINVRSDPRQQQYTRRHGAGDFERPFLAFPE